MNGGNGGGYGCGNGGWYGCGNEVVMTGVMAVVVAVVMVVLKAMVVAVVIKVAGLGENILSFTSNCEECVCVCIRCGILIPKIPLS